jgi:hypothetical protein
MTWHSISSLDGSSFCSQGEVYFIDLDVVGSYSICLQHVGYYENLVTLKKFSEVVF